MSFFPPPPPPSRSQVVACERRVVASAFLDCFGLSECKNSARARCTWLTRPGEDKATFSSGGATVLALAPPLQSARPRIPRRIFHTFWSIRSIRRPRQGLPRISSRSLSGRQCFLPGAGRNHDETHFHSTCLFGGEFRLMLFVILHHLSSAKWS